MITQIMTNDYADYLVGVLICEINLVIGEINRRSS